MMFEQTLTAEKILEMARRLAAETGALRRPHDDLFDFRFRPLGMPVFEAPPPPPRVQVRDITLADGTPLLPAAFRARINADLMERFGFADDIFKDRAYIVGNRALVTSAQNAALLRNIVNLTP